MTPGDKEVLLKDLCARLPYGVKAYVKNWSKFDRKYYEGVYTVESIHPSLNNILVYSERCSVEVIVGYDDYEIKPYLFPITSMTEEQRNEYHELVRGMFGTGVLINFEVLEEFFHKNHIDYRGLIPMGLALDAIYLNIY